MDGEMNLEFECKKSSSNKPQPKKSQKSFNRNSSKTIESRKRLALSQLSPNVVTPSSSSFKTPLQQQEPL
jgi:hypothetical protein